MADLSHKLCEICTKFCPWSQNIIRRLFHVQENRVELPGQNLNALNIRCFKRFEVLEHGKNLCDLRQIPYNVTSLGVMVKLQLKLKKLKRCVQPFVVACRSPQTCKKSASLKLQMTPFQVFPLFVSLSSGSKTDIPHISRYIPTKNKE